MYRGGSSKVHGYLYVSDHSMVIKYPCMSLNLLKLNNSYNSWLSVNYCDIKLTIFHIIPSHAECSNTLATSTSSVIECYRF